MNCGFRLDTYFSEVLVGFLDLYKYFINYLCVPLN